MKLGIHNWSFCNQLVLDHNTSNHCSRLGLVEEVEVVCKQREGNNSQICSSTLSSQSNIE
jgi:hypothetical protein